jgi:UDP-N-acetylmuramoyl-tripeptide--D-alanyl-D-alanine ligase
MKATKVGINMLAKLSRLLHECGFSLAAEAQTDPQLLGVSTDTRTLQPGELFIALPGENFDGHNFVAEAIRRGAAAVVVETGRVDATNISVPAIQVASTVEALGAIALYWRRQCPAQVVTVTGSAGKTTTKDMIASILAQVGPVTVTEATENNELGVAQTLLRLRKHDLFCVLEFGMRGAGEIDYLARISQPSVAVITNIGEAHIGRLGSREAVAQAKAEVLHRLQSDDFAVLNADDFFFSLLAQMTTAQVVSFGFGDADVAVREFTHLGLTGSRMLLRVGQAATDDNLLHVELQVPGRHNAANAAAAAAAAYALGVGLAHISAGLSAFKARDMRSQVIAAHGYTIINDAYNASPTSVPPALEVLALAEGRKLFVFGDMLELGTAAEDAHRHIGRLAAEAQVDIIIAVGELAPLAATEAETLGVQTFRAADAEAAAALVSDIIAPQDTILVKASRGMGLERVVEELLR